MKVFIGCGSNPKINENYLKITNDVCNLLCKHNYDLVFGAYDKGMMKVCYDIFKANKRKIYGIGLDIYKNDLQGVETTNYNTSFKRLEGIFNQSDIFIILPGGTGTLGELFGLLEEFYTNKKDKKLIIYNYDNYYDNIIKFLKDKLQMGFIYDDDINNLIVVDNLEDLERMI